MAFAAVVALEAGPAGSASQRRGEDVLLTTMSVDPGASTPITSSVTLQPGTRYTMEVSGTFQVTDVTGVGFLYDALYCYDGVGFPSPQCQHSGSNDKSSRGKRFAVRVGSSEWAPPDDFGSAGSAGHDTANEVPYREDHSYSFSFFAPQAGKLQAGGANAFPCSGCQGGNYEGGPVVINLYGPPTSECAGQSCHAPADDCPHSAQSRGAVPSAVQNELRVTCVNPDCQFHKGGSAPGAWLPIEKDTVLKQGDEITCDPDGKAVLAFADNSTATVGNTTQLKIASYFTDGGVVRTEILLKMGEVAAQVNKSEATKSDFRIKSPTFTASVRGTKFSVFYDPGSGASVTSVKEGVVTVDPAKPGLPTVDIPAGKEIEVTRSSASKIAPIGKSNLHGGISRMKARDLVLKKIAAKSRCEIVTPRSKAFSVKPAGARWRVSIKAKGGKVKGTSKWLVAGSKVTPANARAKKIARGCP